jgi:hypothetical protein
MPPRTAEAAVAFNSARREKLIVLSLKPFVVVSCDQPQHSRRRPLIAACVPGGNIGLPSVEAENGALRHREAGQEITSELISYSRILS